MRVLPLVLAVVPAVAACKKKEPAAKAKPAPDAALIATPLFDAAPPVKLAAPAGPVEIATDDDCEKTAQYFVPGLRAAAVERGVDIPKLDEAQEGLRAAMVSLCKDEDWQAGILDCVGKNPTDLDTYHRCFERLPTAVRNHWFVELDEVMAKVGGQTQAVPEAPDAQGVTFEELCGRFVAEVARLDDCAGSGFYLPDVEKVYVARRQSEYGGLIPPDMQDRIRKLCEQGADDARRGATDYCGPGVENDLVAPPAP